MRNSRIKVYLYTRVFTLMQIDGYSLDAQKVMGLSSSRRRDAPHEDEAQALYEMGH